MSKYAWINIASFLIVFGVVYIIIHAVHDVIRYFFKISPYIVGITLLAAGILILAFMAEFC